MGSASEAFRLIETGGEPRLHPALDYALCLPLLLSRYSLDSVPFLVRYPQTGTVLKYLELDFRLIQRQVKEELQLEKQNIGNVTAASRARLLEMGTAEERAQVVLFELTKLLRDYEEQDHSQSRRRRRQDSTLIGNPLYRQELAVLLPILRALRSLQDPAPLIASIVLNNPTEFSRTVDSLLDTEDPYNNSKAILLKLCKLADHKIWSIRQRLVDRKVFPNLAIELTIEHCHDEICFMNRILRGQPEWLTNGVDPVTRSSLSSIMEFVFSSLNDELTSEKPDNVAVNRLLRILSGMVGLMSLSLSAEQLEISLGVLEMTPLVSGTIDVKICVILMCASQLLKYSQARVERVLHMLIACHDSPQMLQLVVYFQLQQLLKIDDFASQSLSMTIVIPRVGLMELSALSISLFSSKELATCALQIGRPPATPTPITSTNTSAVSTPMPMPMSTLKASTVSRVQESSQSASELRSTANYLVGYLLQQDIFHKSAIDVRIWVMEQIQASTVPLDTNMIHLLRAYTAATARSKHITRIPESEIRTFFSDPSEDLTPAKVLLVLYMLMYNDVCIASLGSYNMERTQEYDATLLEYVQIRKVFVYVVNFEGGLAFQAVQPMFLKLVYAQFPELFDVTTLLLEEGLATSSSTALPESSVVQPIPHSEDAGVFMEPHIKAIVHHLEDPEAAVKGYHAFQRLSQKDRQTMAGDIIRASLPSLLNPGSDPSVMEAFKRTWDQLNSVMPHELWALTIHALLPQSHVSTYAYQSTAAHPLGQQLAVQQRPSQHPRAEYYTFECLAQDPLLLFKVDFRVFRSPIVFRLFVQILGSVMIGSRHWFRKRFHALQSILQSQQNRNPAQAQRRQFKEANLSAMLYIQDSVLIQLMLEACQARPEDVVDRPRLANGHSGDSGATKGTHGKDGKKIKDSFSSHMDEVSDALKEVRVVTFNFLHLLFIDHKIFPKLVHFQGYALDLLPITVAGIDSIHVCMDFLQEILFANSPASASASGSTGSTAASGGAAGEDNNRVDVSPQVFALRLSAQLCERFPLPNTMQMATDFILPKLRSLAASTGFAQDVLESAVVLAKAFPSMSGEIVDLLQEVSGPHDKMALMRTIEAINEVLSDPAVLDKSLL
ncbi:Integrator complex subunit 2 [Mortierella sp. NVP85]|nr:Integrator complex subunit 2 [Mortierella sp. NVP85]